MGNEMNSANKRDSNITDSSYEESHERSYEAYRGKSLPEGYTPYKNQVNEAEYDRYSSVYSTNPLTNEKLCLCSRRKYHCTLGFSLTTSNRYSHFVTNLFFKDPYSVSAKRFERVIKNCIFFSIQISICVFIFLAGIVVLVICVDGQCSQRCEDICANGYCVDQICICNNGFVQTGNVCEVLYCDNKIPCYNGGTCQGSLCQCNQDNNITKYHGPSCDMPRACEGNPCQNRGVCIPTILSDSTESFSCDCDIGFSGFFCEFKSPNDHLFFLSTPAKYFGANSSQSSYLFVNDKGKLEDTSYRLDERIGENSGAYRSCSVMLNGEAIIFGGNHGMSTNINSQISVVYACGSPPVRRLGNLPFNFTSGACGTFMFIDSQTILLCFSNANERRKCWSLRRRNASLLSSINNFVFENEFV